LALFLAWAYEITPDGIKTDSGGAAASSSANNLNAGLFVLLIALAGSGLYIYNSPDGTRQVNETEQASDSITPVDLEKSIAVLPFTAFSSNPEEQFFADGLADTLLLKLAQLSDIRVISRTSSFQYRGGRWLSRNGSIGLGLCRGCNRKFSCSPSTGHCFL
jgi:hypothetical protein